jgi:hypothetical protein
MLNIALSVLGYCGASPIYECALYDDPTTEEEFKLLKYDSPTPITWEQYQAAIPIVFKKRGIQLLRFIRNKDLQASDWIMTVDNQMTIQNFQEFIDYRQRLRDFITESTTIIWKSFPNELDLEAINYPKLPTIIRKQ